MIKNRHSHGPSPFSYILMFVLAIGTRTFAEEAAGSHQNRERIAETLARLDAQLAEWDDKIAKEQDSVLRTYRRNDKALCAWRAAQTVVREGAYDAASRYLDLMRDFGQTWVSEEGGKKRDHLCIFMAGSNSVPVRIEFANGFWIANPPALGVGHAEARQILLDTLKLTVTPDQRLQLYQLIQQYSFAIPDTATASDYTERICADFAAQSDVCDQALFALAQHFSAQGQPRRASETLQRILTLHPTSGLAGMVHLGLSEVFAGLGDETKMLEHLELAANMPPKETHRSIMDSSDTRQVAVVRLGQHYQARNDFGKALECFRAWQPRSWCGNGQAQFAYERDLYIAQCLVNLGKSDQALKENLMPHLVMDEGELYHDARMPDLVVRLYEDKNDLDGLIKTLRPHAAAKYNRTAQIALGLAEIRAECRNGRIDALVNRLRHSGSYVPNVREPRDNWQAPAAARALSEMKGKEYPALRRQYEALLRDKDKEETYGRLIWVLYAIALSHTLDARAFLEELLKKGEIGNPRDTIGVGIDDIRFLVSVAEKKSLEQSASPLRETRDGSREGEP